MHTNVCLTCFPPMSQFAVKAGGCLVNETEWFQAGIHAMICQPIPFKSTPLAYMWLHDDTVNLNAWISNHMPFGMNFLIHSQPGDKKTSISSIKVIFIWKYFIKQDTTHITIGDTPLINLTTKTSRTQFVINVGRWRHGAYTVHDVTKMW